MALPDRPTDDVKRLRPFLHHFAASLNPHFYFNLVVDDGLFERGEHNRDQNDLDTPVRPAFIPSTTSGSRRAR